MIVGSGVGSSRAGRGVEVGLEAGGGYLSPSLVSNVVCFVLVSLGSTIGLITTISSCSCQSRTRFT